MNETGERARLLSQASQTQKEIDRRMRAGRGTYQVSGQYRACPSAPPHSTVPKLALHVPSATSHKKTPRPGLTEARRSKASLLTLDDPRRGCC